jgi:hypothetical protein
MWRVSGACFSRSSTVHPSMPGEVDVQRDRRRAVVAHQLQPRLAVQRHHGLEAALARHVQQDAGEGGVVLHDQHRAVARLYDPAVVADPHLGGVARALPRAPRPRAPRAARGARRGAAGAGGAQRRRVARQSPPSPPLRPPPGSPGQVRGRKRVKVLPSPCVLSTRISPPSSRVISRLMESPSPVPP